jgi:hypothetical protein
MKDVFHWESERPLMPPELLEIAFKFDRDLNKLWKVELPVETLPVSALEWHLDMPFFWQDEKPFSLKPREVLNHPEQYAYWMQRIMQVDTSYPLDILLWNGNWQIIDGLHRLCKQIALGKTTVAVRKLPHASIKLIQPEAS